MTKYSVSVNPFSKENFILSSKLMLASTIPMILLIIYWFSITLISVRMTQNSIIMYYIIPAYLVVNTLVATSFLSLVNVDKPIE